MRSLRILLASGVVLGTLGTLGCGGGGSSSAPSATATGTAPTADFSYSPSAPTTGHAVTFTDASTHTPTSWAWDFGDGSTSTAQNTTHTYNAAKTYTVQLKATNAAGSGTTSKTVTVDTASTTPAADFTFTPTPPMSGQTVTFTDASGGTPTAWTWDFGDGKTSTDRNPTHVYTTTSNCTYPVTLTVTYASGTQTASKAVTVTAAATAAAAAFVYAPTVPVAAESVAFRDTSTGSPTAWSWTFGDGATSTAQNPTHAYATANTYTVALTATYASGTSTASHAVTVTTAATASAFDGNIVLGCPTETSIKANVFSPDQSGTVYLAYGTATGTSYGTQTSVAQLQAATPLELALEGLSADTQYYYRLYYKAAGASAYTATDEYTFHTARPAGSTFTFCIQGDSHPERVNTQFDSDLYTRTMQTAATDNPDFYMTIGDDFSIDQINQADPTAVTADQVTERYLIQRPYLGLIGRSASVFLVNGNHEQAARYLLDGTPNNPAVWAQNARNTHYSQPASDAFYSGNAEEVPYIGLLRNYYAWTWGDALFVTLDPYWGSPTCVDNPFYGGSKRSNLWSVTHGDEQYQWLKTTLEQSTAKYKFVFAHHVMGTGRGGIEEAGLYEWGGYDSNGTTYAFTTERPTWTEPIHKLMVDNHVTIFFQGHDHIWVHQELDGVVYQTLSEPADPNYSLFNSDAYLTGDKFPNTGYTRVTVSSSGVKVEYVLTYLPKDEGSGKVNGAVAFSYSLP